VPDAAPAAIGSAGMDMLGDDGVLRFDKLSHAVDLIEQAI
jgi:hypothetical protein